MENNFNLNEKEKIIINFLNEQNKPITIYVICAFLNSSYAYVYNILEILIVKNYVKKINTGHNKNLYVAINDNVTTFIDNEIAEVTDGETS